MAEKAEVRRTLLQIALRHGKPGAGSPRAFLLQRTYEMQVADLRPFLDPIAWAVVGAMAARHYMPERTTQALEEAQTNRDGSLTWRT